MSESAKILKKIEKYLYGNIWDIGCGDKKILDNAIGFDFIDHPNVDVVFNADSEDLKNNFYSQEKKPDVIFSSHFLEHIIDPIRFICDCYDILEANGKLILYLPDTGYYNNRTNPWHLHSFEYQVFLRFFVKAFNHFFTILEHGEDFLEVDHYSFYIVAQKKN